MNAVWGRVGAPVAVMLLLAMLSSTSVAGAAEVIDFESDSWVLRDAEVVDHLGRKCLVGFACLEGVQFEDGVIEVDIAVDGSRSYPGLVFRIQSEENYERFYIRPHRAGLYPDALQYTPVFNGIAGWQLYNGDGYTAGAELPANEWVRVRLEVQGSRARVFIGGSDRPALVINELKHRSGKGTIGVFGPRDGTAHFSEFRYSTDAVRTFDSPPPSETPPGIVSQWQLSQAYKLSDIDRETYPGAGSLQEMEWQEISSEPSGLVDVARYVKRVGREPDCVLARTVIRSDAHETRKFLFGYSDQVSVFLNGKLLFSASSQYRERDPSFLGIIGLHDAVYLPLEEGENELLLLVTEVFGGWGFMCQDASAVFLGKGVESAWETGSQFLVPESAVYDPVSNALYVSNYDMFGRSAGEERQFISKLSVDGTVETLKWIQGLNRPTGMAMFGDKLFVVERGNLVEVEAASGQILQRYPLPQPVFPNDVAIDESGNAYVSDTAKNVIYRSSDGAFEIWLSGDEISMPNGLHVQDNSLIVGNSGDGCLKSVDLDSKEIRTIARLGSGIIDGIRSDGHGNYIVSHWEGRVYRITAGGETTKLLDTSVRGFSCADIEYVVEKKLLVVPTFADNRVAAYELRD
ncbi:MAG: SMP-30/gluconolactonase/LRE family protein [Candidatus Eiseniibacteriota bacterium]|nr:MAG: SMP-30/gluconolactonase/LRE family protein [Candidatus Eisenbacteria bacterium]